VAEIQKMWVEEGYEDRIRKRFFKILGSDGYTHILFYNETLRLWFLR
jgi:hypothetical protein